MDILNHLATTAPLLTSARDAKPTLLVSWWCTCYAIAIIVIRFCGRYVRAEKVFLEDGIMMLAITPLMIRMVFVHFVLRDGTNNVLVGIDGDVGGGLSAEEVERRVLGSQLVLGARVFYAAYLWAIKYSTTHFLRTLTSTIWQRSHQRLLLYLHIFLGVTFVSTIIADLGACQPFSHYWQVVPDPGPSCRTGAAHLYTLGVLHIVTNLALIVFPIPMILGAKISRGQKLSILLLLSLPLLSISLTIYSLPHITRHHFSQQRRSLLASLDMLLNTFTANAVVLFSLLADRGYKKSKFKNDFAGTKTGRSGVIKGGKGSLGRADERWGSDEDLMEGKGAGVVIGMRDLGEGERERDRDGEEDEGIGPLAGGGLGRKKSVGIARPKEARLGDIRVASTWEIRVDDKD